MRSREKVFSRKRSPINFFRLAKRGKSWSSKLILLHVCRNIEDKETFARPISQEYGWIFAARFAFRHKNGYNNFARRTKDLISQMRFEYVARGKSY